MMDNTFKTISNLEETEVEEDVIIKKQ